VNPIRTYEIRVQGFPPALYCARSPGKARSRCWGDYQTCHEATFREFLKISSCRVVPNPPGVGDRVLIAGLPATRVYHPCAGHYTWFMRDDSDAILCSHPLDVQPMPAAA
jgi:hypothetical protein